MTDFEHEPLILYHLGDLMGLLGVYKRCPKCGRWLKHGQVWVNGLDEVKLTEWTCKKDGEVKPNYEFVDEEFLTTD